MKTLLLLLFVSLSLFASPQGEPVHSEATVTSTASLALAANKNRGYLLIQNKGSVSCYVRFGSTFTGTNGVLITTGQYYEPVSAFVKSAVYVVCASGSNTIHFAETNW